MTDEALTPGALVRLAAWTSAAYPTGGFAYSHGLEALVAEAAVHDAATLADWAEDALAHGAGRTDAILAAHAWRAAAGEGGPALDEIAELARALAPSASRLAETDALGAAFAHVTAAAWDGPGEALPHPVALGRAAGAAGIPLLPALTLLLQGFAAMIVSAGVRLVPLGQTDGQRVLARLAPLSIRLAEEAATAPLEEVGGACYGWDIAAMAQETLEPRLFRS